MDIHSGRFFFDPNSKVNNDGDDMSIIEALSLIIIIFILVYLVDRLVASHIFEPAAEKMADVLERKDKAKLKDLFLDNAMFCKDCFLYDYWFTGGGSWAPERCPFHPKSDEVILWKQMTKAQRKKAARWHDSLWLGKFDCHYFNDRQRELF